MSNLFIPPCPETCSGYVADVNFNDCTPEKHWGEVSKIYLVGTDFAGFADVSALGEWTTNLSDTSDDGIRTLVVIGDLPEAETTEVPMSGDRIAIGYKTFNLNFEIDETNDTNYNFLLMSECGGKYLMWFETSDGLLFGGNDGIEVSLRMNYIVPRERTALQKIMAKATWKSLQSPFRCDSPMA
ncbi:MAG: hypothetical protein ABFC18_03500 [Rikenellaceae bacterium]